MVPFTCGCQNGNAGESGVARNPLVRLEEKWDQAFLGQPTSRPLRSRGGLKQREWWCGGCPAFPVPRGLWQPPPRAAWAPLLTRVSRAGTPTCPGAPRLRPAPRSELARPVVWCEGVGEDGRDDPSSDLITLKKS